MSFTVLAFAFGTEGSADPIHAIADGAYWHHDSGWIFPAKVRDFVRVSAPQDVAGSQDAVAYYAQVFDGERWTAALDLYLKESALSEPTFDAAKTSIANDGEASSECTHADPLAIDGDLPIVVSKATCRSGAATTLLYFIEYGDWRVKIRASGRNPNSQTLQVIDEFVRIQPWHSLGR